MRAFFDATQGRAQRTVPQVLIVEDERFFLQVLRSALGLAYPLQVAMDASEGWQRYLDHAPDIAFIDVEMQGIDGHTLAASIRALDAQAFIVMVTAHTDPTTMARARENNVRAFVSKPYSTKMIADCIAQYMAERAGPAVGATHS